MQGRIYSREDIVRALDADIAKEINRLGEGSFWVKVYRDKKVHVLAQYDAGKAVLVETGYRCENGIEYETQYYSDGSVKDVCYGYCD